MSVRVLKRQDPKIKACTDYLRVLSQLMTINSAREVQKAIRAVKGTQGAHRTAKKKAIAKLMLQGLCFQITSALELLDTSQ